MSNWFLVDDFKGSRPREKHQSSHLFFDTLNKTYDNNYIFHHHSSESCWIRKRPPIAVAVQHAHPISKEGWRFNEGCAGRLRAWPGLPESSIEAKVKSPRQPPFDSPPLPPPLPPLHNSFWLPINKIISFIVNSTSLNGIRINWGNYLNHQKFLAMTEFRVNWSRRCQIR